LPHQLLFPFGGSRTDVGRHNEINFALIVPISQNLLSRCDITQGFELADSTPGIVNNLSIVLVSAILDESALSILSCASRVEKSWWVLADPEAKWVVVFFVCDHFLAREIADNLPLFDRLRSEHAELALLAELACFTLRNSQAAFDLLVLVAINPTLSSMQASSIQSTPFCDGLALHRFEDGSLGQLVIDTFAVHFV